MGQVLGMPRPVGTLLWETVMEKYRERSKQVKNMWIVHMAACEHHPTDLSVWDD